MKPARAKKKNRQQRAIDLVVDATPERLAKAGDGAEYVDPAKLDSSEQRIGRVRRFRDTWIDRLHRNGKLTYAQWFACNWYRELHAQAFTPQRVVADYGQSSGGMLTSGCGLPFNEAQLRKRRMFREAQAAIPANATGLMDQVVLHDDLPAFPNGRVRQRFTRVIVAASQALADHIRAPV